MAGGSSLSRSLRLPVQPALFAGLWALGIALAQPTIDANHASLAEIERMRGMGTSIAANLVDARNKAAFKDWNDLIRRVRGIGVANAALLSEQGLTVNGAAYPTPAPAQGTAAATPAK
jgi:competence protein ComEA